MPLRITGWFVNPGTDEPTAGRHLRQPRGHAGEGLPDGSDLARCRVDVEGAGSPSATALTAKRRGRLWRCSLTSSRYRSLSIVDNLGEIGSTPWLLAGFLALIGVGLAHALMVGVQRHRHDVAVVRALGLRPTQARSVVRWQASILAALGAGLGLVVGLLVGRLVWQRVVHGVGALVSVQVRRVGAARSPSPSAWGCCCSSSGRRVASLSPATVLKAE